MLHGSAADAADGLVDDTIGVPVNGVAEYRTRRHPACSERERERLVAKTGGRSADAGAGITRMPGCVVVTLGVPVSVTVMTCVPTVSQSGIEVGRAVIRGREGVVVGQRGRPIRAGKVDGAEGPVAVGVAGGNAEGTVISRGDAGREAGNRDAAHRRRVDGDAGLCAGEPASGRLGNRE